MTRIIRNDGYPEIIAVKRQALRLTSRNANARRDIAEIHAYHIEYAAAVEDSLDEMTPSYQRHRITRWFEVTSLVVLGTAEVIVANNVVQALGLTATATRLVAVAVGGAATGLAWLVGHEWAISCDPQLVLTGRRGWLGLAITASAAFLTANLGVRVYYGVLLENVQRLGNGLLAPLLSGLLLTVVTAALMVVAAFVSAHAETSKEAQLRAKLRRLRRVLRSLERAGSRLGPNRRLRSIPHEETPAA